jgi:hypothetical protein
VRHLQIGFVDHLVTQQHQIQIERTRRASVGTLTPAFPLDLEQQAQEIARAEGRFADEYCVQIVRLVCGVGNAFGFGLDEVGDRQRRDEWCEAIGGKQNRCAAIAEVAAQGDRDAMRGQVYSTQRVGSTTPAVPAPSLRRPSKSVRPASA